MSPTHNLTQFDTLTLPSPLYTQPAQRLAFSAQKKESSSDFTFEAKPEGSKPSFTITGHLGFVRDANPPRLEGSFTLLYSGEESPEKGQLLGVINKAGKWVLTRIGTPMPENWLLSSSSLKL